MSITDLHDAFAYASRRTSRVAAAVCVALASTGMIASFAASAAEAKTDVKLEKGAVQSGESDAEREKKLASARKRLDEAAREVAELSMQMSEDAMPRVSRIFSRNASRAMLGVNIGGDHDRDRERKDGVELLSVSPGGPAAEAGLKAGDVIVELKGKSLKQTGDETPREKLLTAMREVNPEEKITVRYLRDGKTASADVVARPVDRMFTMPFAVHGAVPAPGRVPPPPHIAFFRADGIFGSAELVPLTPKLGQYFGAEKGLLVVRAPDSRMKLEEGDVIVDIDGRVPSNSAHAFRILGSYQAGEKVKLNVLRMKKRTTIDLTIPEDEKWERRFERSRFLPPPPPAPGDVVIPAPAPAPALPVPPPNDAA
ncbi:MAG TPA: PDZ domain-containing protein [Steroidobacteraceae bacterium]|nr:PDZ domain-containing protein [Steroidobacteraceae bacterium]